MHAHRLVPETNPLLSRYPNPISAHTAAHFAGCNEDSRPPPQLVVALQPPSLPRFPFGQLVITAAAAEVIPADEALLALRRHAAGDWGEVCPEDWARNDEALRDGERLFSCYVTQDKERFWIVTEANRRITTILLPSDY